MPTTESSAPGTKGNQRLSSSSECGTSVYNSPGPAPLEVSSEIDIDTILKAYTEHESMATLLFRVGAEAHIKTTSQVCNAIIGVSGMIEY